MNDATMAIDACTTLDRHDQLLAHLAERITRQDQDTTTAPQPATSTFTRGIDHE